MDICCRYWLRAHLVAYHPAAAMRFPKIFRAFALDISALARWLKRDGERG